MDQWCFPERLLASIFGFHHRPASALQGNDDIESLTNILELFGDWLRCVPLGEPAGPARYAGLHAAPSLCKAGRLVQVPERRVSHEALSGTS